MPRNFKNKKDKYTRPTGLSHCATRRKVAVLTPDGVIGVIH